MHVYFYVHQVHANPRRTGNCKDYWCVLLTISSSARWSRNSCVSECCHGLHRQQQPVNGKFEDTILRTIHSDDEDVDSIITDDSGEDED